MAEPPSLVESLDAALSNLIVQWNVYSTGLVTLIVLVVTYSIVSSRDPDIHPLLLARQALPSAVRQEGESALYRAQAAPHAFPLNSGLNVKDAGASKYSRGRDGDLRDVWRKAVVGGEKGARGRLMTVLGSEVVEHRLEDITRQINLIGKHIADQGGIRVAVYLPNSIELLATLFACSNYPNLTTVLIPFDLSNEQLTWMLRRSASDTLVTAPESFPVDLIETHPSLRHLIWVVDEGNKHMDWTEVPKGAGIGVEVTTWQDIINDAPPGVGTELMPADPANVPGDVVTFWRSKPGEMDEMVRFSQANIVAGMAGQIAAVPPKHRFSSSDLFLPADCLTDMFTLVLTLTALYQNTSVALNAVAGQVQDLELATRSVAPTIVVASPYTLLRMHQNSMGKLVSVLGKASHALATRRLVRDGTWAPSNALSSFASSARPSVGTAPGELRLVYTAERTGTDSPSLSGRVLSDLRILLGARIMYALAAPRVAGAVTQTALYDYRVEGDGKGHFGCPTTSVEVFLKDAGPRKTTDDRTEGRVFARGPCVAGGEADVGLLGRIKDDNTLACI